MTNSNYISLNLNNVKWCFFNCTIFASWCVILGVHVWILVSWSASVGWLVVPQSLIPSITAACWVWTRFRIKPLCTLSCYKLTSGPTRFALLTYLQSLVEKSFSQEEKNLFIKKMHIYADKSEEKCLINLKKWFIIYWLQKISYYLSDFIHIQLLSPTSKVSKSIIRVIDRYTLSSLFELMVTMVIIYVFLNSYSTMPVWLPVYWTNNH